MTRIGYIPSLERGKLLGFIIDLCAELDTKARSEEMLLTDFHIALSKNQDSAYKVVR